MRRASWLCDSSGEMQREFASGLDPTPNRMYHSRLFRWMSLDRVHSEQVLACFILACEQAHA